MPFQKVHFPFLQSLPSLLRLLLLNWGGAKGNFGIQRQTSRVNALQLHLFIRSDVSASKCFAFLEDVVSTNKVLGFI